MSSELSHKNFVSKDFSNKLDNLPSKITKTKTQGWSDPESPSFDKHINYVKGYDK